MSTNKPLSDHWADIYADKVVRERAGRETFVCASGITPSGTVHIGNFREIISVDLVVRALRDRGEKVRFLYSWDDYDVFRKVPENMPHKDILEKHLRFPITEVPDVIGDEESYARHNERLLEKVLPIVGIEPEYIYQGDQYGSGTYAKGIKKALEKKELIREHLNEHRREPLPDDWLPVSVFCQKCRRDTTKATGWDGDWGVSYQCESCGNDETVDLRTTGVVKLPWRIDWPMRWAYEKVDFEPAGKDHHTEGGSFDTARRTVKEVYDFEAPITFRYDFVRIKGLPGKMSSSRGNLLSLEDVLKVYQPEVVRFLFAGTRPNAEFAISFDLDVLKIYEDYDRCEQAAFESPKEGKAGKKQAKLKRIYELSQVNSPPQKMPLQVPFRHLCNLLQINDGNIDVTLSQLGAMDAEDERRLRERSVCAINWLTLCAYDEFRFSLRSIDDPPLLLDEPYFSAVQDVKTLINEKMEVLDEKIFAEEAYALLKKHKIESADFFPIMYQILINRGKGPRLIPFLKIIGRERAVMLLGNVKGSN